MPTWRRIVTMIIRGVSGQSEFGMSKMRLGLVDLNSGLAKDENATLFGFAYVITSSVAFR